jgi:hypothetical protein
MQTTPQKPSVPQENATQLPESNVPSIVTTQPGPAVENPGTGRASPKTEPVDPSWSAPVSEKLKTPAVQSASAEAPTQESETTPPGPKIDDPVTDRNGRAPNPPATPAN